MKRLANSVLLVGLVTLSVAAQVNPACPRLVVGIVVDQLRTDYIEYLQNYFGERGFKTLLNDGVYLTDVDFAADGLDAINSTAMLFTGAYPSQTGVPAASISEYAATGLVSRPPLASNRASNLTNDSFTPEGLRLSTIADELVIDASGASSVYSVSADPQQAVVMAGHAGKGAYWINNTSGNWASTGYYGQLPSVVSNRNLRGALSQRIDTMQWRPSARLTSVPWISQQKKITPFKYTFSRKDRDVYKKFAASPLSNTEVTNVAIDLIRNLNLGSRPGETDMLNVAYTLAPYKFAAESSTQAELADAYLRLDGQLSRLFDAIESSVGRSNSLIWLTSTGYYDDCVAVEDKYRLPGGDFSTRRARSLLNSYLSAKFGSGEYVASIHDGQVWFDLHTIESKRLDSSEVITDAKLFLAKMSGIAEVKTLDEILAPRADEDLRLLHSVDPRYSGDIFVKFTPGWTVVYDEQNPVVEKYTRYSAIATPAFFLVPGINPKKIDSPVEAVQIAPTVSGALRIRSPNGVKSRPISLN